jgi:hypothetical protein
MRHTRLGWRLAFSIASAFNLAGCDGVARGVIQEATSPKEDALCTEAFAHLRECDARFPERSALCTFSDGECAPYVNAEQSRCLHEASCEAVRTAVDARSWLCGLSLATRPMRDDR